MLTKIGFNTNTKYLLLRKMPISISIIKIDWQFNFNIDSIPASAVKLCYKTNNWRAVYMSWKL